MNNTPRYKLYGDSCILVEWEAVISDEILRNIVKFQKKLETQLKEKIVECIPAYHSLLVVFNAPISSDLEINQLTEIHQLSEGENEELSGRIWNIPVCYHPDFGFDLERFAGKKGMEIREIIHLHTSVLYTVHFIGFLPGFLYLGGLDPALHEPRKKAPLKEIPKGSVAIGGDQTGIYPCKSPGGWHVIGNTPINTFDISQDPPTFASAGDKVRFVSISVEEYHSLSKRATEAPITMIHELAGV